MKKYAIIVAGGSGTRMGSSVPKQYLEIAGKPVLMHTLEVFHQFDTTLSLILVIPSADFDFWKTLCFNFNFQTPHALIAGGNSRFQSVKNGLASIGEKEGLVAVHDGVRPLVSMTVIANSFDNALKMGSGVAVMPLKDSLRKVLASGKSESQNREDFRMVQTPQTFRLDRLKKAYEAEESKLFTDDATVYEFQGWEVDLIAGNSENIKITTPEDLQLAAYLLQKRKK